MPRALLHTHRSQPRPHIPTTTYPERSYDIKYYPRDSRRNPWEEVEEAPEATFFQIDTEAHLARKPQIEEPKRGSKGTGVRCGRARVARASSGSMACRHMRLTVTVRRL